MPERTNSTIATGWAYHWYFNVDLLAKICVVSGGIPHLQNLVPTPLPFSSATHEATQVRNAPKPMPFTGASVGQLPVGSKFPWIFLYFWVGSFVTFLHFMVHRWECLLICSTEGKQGEYAGERRKRRNREGYRVDCEDPFVHWLFSKWVHNQVTREEKLQQMAKVRLLSLEREASKPVIWFGSLSCPVSMLCFK